MIDFAEVAEQADAHDSKSCTYGYVGSIPTFGTITDVRAHHHPGEPFCLPFTDLKFLDNVTQNEGMIN